MTYQNDAQYKVFEFNEMSVIIRNLLKVFKHNKGISDYQGFKGWFLLVCWFVPK